MKRENSAIFPLTRTGTRASFVLLHKNGACVREVGVGVIAFRQRAGGGSRSSEQKNSPRFSPRVVDKASLSQHRFYVPCFERYWVIINYGNFVHYACTYIRRLVPQLQAVPLYQEVITKGISPVPNGFPGRIFFFRGYITVLSD